MATSNGAKVNDDDDDGDGDDDDYLSMAFDEPPTAGKKPETSIQRRARLQREGQARARIKSKAEIAADEAAARDAALETSLDSSNRGFRMMAKLGFKGGALGKEGTGSRLEPIKPVVKEDRGGIGLDAEKKRKIREEVGEVEKRTKMDEGGYRERLQREREEKRIEGQIIGAMNVAEALEEGTFLQNIPMDGIAVTKELHGTNSKRPLKSINVLWRGLARHRIEKERDRRMRYDLQQSLSRLPTYEDSNENADDKRALGTEEEEIEEEDVKLDQFNALDPPERLEKVVAFMRTTFHYCFWCKFKYTDERMEGCPGLTEEDHD